MSVGIHGNCEGGILVLFALSKPTNRKNSRNSYLTTGKSICSFYFQAKFVHTNKSNVIVICLHFYCPGVIGKHVLQAEAAGIR